MQKMNWNDFRYILAIKNMGTLSGAARLLGVDATTVSRRLAALSRSVNAELFVRMKDGKLELTESGQRIARHAETMEAEAELIREMQGNDDDSCWGQVRITAVPVIMNRVLVPNLGRILENNPNLQIDLIPDSKNFSLNHREADIAIRLARPTSGGTNTMTRRMGNLDYAVYASAELINSNNQEIPWIRACLCRVDSVSFRARI